MSFSSDAAAAFSFADPAAKAIRRNDPERTEAVAFGAGRGGALRDFEAFGAAFGAAGGGAGGAFDISGAAGGGRVATFASSFSIVGAGGGGGATFDGASAIFGGGGGVSGCGFEAVEGFGAGALRRATVAGFFLGADFFATGRWTVLWGERRTVRCLTSCGGLRTILPGDVTLPLREITGNCGWLRYWYG